KWRCDASSRTDHWIHISLGCASATAGAERLRLRQSGGVFRREPRCGRSPVDTWFGLSFPDCLTSRRRASSRTGDTSSLPPAPYSSRLRRVAAICGSIAPKPANQSLCKGSKCSGRCCQGSRRPSESAERPGSASRSPTIAFRLRLLLFEELFEVAALRRLDVRRFGSDADTNAGSRSSSGAADGCAGAAGCARCGGSYRRGWRSSAECLPDVPQYLARANVIRAFVRVRQDFPLRVHKNEAWDAAPSVLAERLVGLDLRILQCRPGHLVARHVGFHRVLVGVAADKDELELRMLRFVLVIPRHEIGRECAARPAPRGGEINGEVLGVCERRVIKFANTLSVQSDEIALETRGNRFSENRRCKESKTEHTEGERLHSKEKKLGGGRGVASGERRRDSTSNAQLPTPNLQVAGAYAETLGNWALSVERSTLSPPQARFHQDACANTRWAVASVALISQLHVPVREVDEMTPGFVN